MAYIPGQGPFNPHLQRSPAPKQGFNPHAPRAAAVQGVIPPATSTTAAIASPIISSGPYQTPNPSGRETINRGEYQKRY